VSQNIYVFCGSVEGNNCLGILQFFGEVDESMRLNWLHSGGWGVYLRGISLITRLNSIRDYTYIYVKYRVIRHLLHWDPANFFERTSANSGPTLNSPASGVSLGAKHKLAFKSMLVVFVCCLLPLFKVQKAWNANKLIEIPAAFHVRLFALTGHNKKMKARPKGKHFFSFFSWLDFFFFLASCHFPWLSKHLAGVKKCRQV